MEKQIIKFEHNYYKLRVKNPMAFSIIPAKDFKTINWSGGTSTQLYIYPETAKYELRDFDFRLSTAKVEVEQSDFTSLPGVSRKIMVLDGQIEISHKNLYNKILHELDVDAFEGDWQTSSIGLCTDFNLMTKGKTKGELSSLSILQGQTTDYPIPSMHTMIFIYLYTGEIGLDIEQNDLILNQGELLILDNLNTNNLNLTAYKDSQLIISEVSL
ncbi:hypothetical protein EO244_11050 [Ancylomarina salipaludis]|uniref:HutD family protein n=1 Tax=Ancylomarina salipaludis TaxID=2501299 RepID=A0A4Q1JLF3_9BACT|nr:HutD family protein [Ancylomarina salipaludis]RXQ93001.1 hypothetical protein EO244_11050 [Ancylomarina salipaludis]